MLKRCGKAVVIGQQASQGRALAAQRRMVQGDAHHDEIVLTQNEASANRADMGNDGRVVYAMFRQRAAQLVCRRWLANYNRDMSSQASHTSRLLHKRRASRLWSGGLQALV